MRIDTLHTVILFVASIFACINLNAGEKSDITIPVCKQPPKLNGILDDGCWNTASKIKDFTIYRSGSVGRNTNDTEVFLTRDNKFLYIGLICHNPNMQHVSQSGMEHDDLANFSDDSVEILLGRDNLGYFYHYIITCGNIQGESRSANSSATGWNMPWASAAKRSDKGWIAEIAIPLFIINSRKLSDIGLNFLRNKMEIALDNMGAKESEKKVVSCWKILNPKDRKTSCPSFQPIPLRGTQNIKAEPVFLPHIVKVLPKGYKKGPDGKLQQVFETQLRNYSYVSGTAKLEILGEKLEKPLAQVNQKISPISKCSAQLNVSSTIDSGKLSLVVYGDNNLPFQTVLLQNEAALISDIFTERSYYTTEKTVKIKVEFNLSAALLKNCILFLKDTNGKKVEKVVAPARKIIIKVASNKLAEGKNIWSASLGSKEKIEYEKRNLTIVKLAPNPGKEIKIDRFRRIVLKNGKAFFPFGIYENLEMKGLYPDFKKACDEHFSMLKATGFNTVIRAYRRLGVVRKDPFKANEYMEMLKKYDLMFIDFYGDLLCARSKDHDYYAKVLAGFMKDYNVISKSPNLLGYYNLDEPNLHDWKKNLEICDWFYKDMKKLDPYRINFLLFACSVPQAGNALTSGDVFAYDIYYLSGKSPKLTINYVAKKTAELNERVKPFHKPIMIVPLSTSLGAHRTPISISYQEQINQAYAALIYGSKGIIYYHSYITWGEHTWRAFKKLAADIKIFEPALMSEAPDYRISYKKSKVDITKGILPQVHVGLFRYPDGRYLLLMANGNWYPMNIELNIPGLLKASGICGDGQKYSVAKGTFNARFEKYGVRAIELKVENVDGPLEIMAKESGKVPHDSRVYVEDMLRIVKKRKNKAFNPSFELCSAVEGVIPDYYSPGFAMPGAEKIGLKDNKTWGLDTNNPFFGKYCMRTAHVVNSMMYMPKGDAYPQKYMFSAYMKGDKNGDEIVVGIASVVSQKFKLTTEWKRYSMAFTVEKPGNKSLLRSAFYPQKGATVWIDGIQVEKGEKMTPFSDK